MTKRLFNKSFLIILLCSFYSCKEQTGDTWQIALKTDKDGAVLLGSKQELIKELRSGADLKLGWGWKNESKSLEHFAYPNWIGILNEKEVYAYLDPQVLSGINWESLNANYSDSTLLQKEWRVVINTDGSFDAVWIDRNSNELHKRVPQTHVMTWWIKSGAKKAAMPHYLKEE